MSQPVILNASLQIITGASIITAHINIQHDPQVKKNRKYYQVHFAETTNMRTI